MPRAVRVGTVVDPVRLHAALRPRPVRRRWRGRARTCELVTSRFVYGDGAARGGLRGRRALLPRRPGAARPRARVAAKLAAARARTCSRYARAGARGADVVHFQWLDGPAARRGPAAARPRPLVLTAHDVLPREPRPGQLAAQRALYGRVDAVVVHSEHGRARLRRGDRRPPGQGDRDPARRVRTPPGDDGRCRPSSPASRGPSSCSSASCARTRASTCCSRPGAGSRRRAVGRRHAADGHAPLRARRRRPACASSRASSPDAQVAGALPPRRPRRPARTARSTSPACCSPRSASARRSS